jgi:hypothetical protein
MKRRIIITPKSNFRDNSLNPCTLLVLIHKEPVERYWPGLLVRGNLLMEAVIDTHNMITARATIIGR